MFHPTIFENWKVVVEGAVYDLDREGTAEVVYRKDLVDLAELSRSFRICIRLPEGNCLAELSLKSELVDFAGELIGLQTSVTEQSGIQLKLKLTLPGARVRNASEIHSQLQSLWAGEAEVSHRVQIEIDPQMPSHSSAADNSRYDVAILFLEKWNEHRIGDMGLLGERFLASLRLVENG